MLLRGKKFFFVISSFYINFIFDAKSSSHTVWPHLKPQHQNWHLLTVNYQDYTNNGAVIMRTEKGQL